MEQLKRTLYESPQVEVMTLHPGSHILTVSDADTGESFNNPVDYDLISGDWTWII